MKLFICSLLLALTTNAFSQQPITSAVFHWSELPVKKDGPRESRKIAEGATSEFEYFEIHATTQAKGAAPRPAHTQKDIEEVIIIKEGTAKCTIGNKTATLSKGSVLLIPPQESQTIENVGNGPLTYYVFMFRSRKGMNMERSNAAGGALLLNYDSLAYSEKNNRGTRKYFDRPTAMCENYEMHILMIDGNTSMTIDGKTYTAGPGDFYIIESGKLHGVSNATDKPCTYFAFKWR